MLSYRWMYDSDPQIALMLRSDFRRRHRRRLKLAGLRADGPDSGLARAEELYVGLCGENPENERLWTAHFHIHERTGSSLGLSTVRPCRSTWTGSYSKYGGASAATPSNRQLAVTSQ
jgi:hypothetical protein